MSNHCPDHTFFLSNSTYQTKRMPISQNFKKNNIRVFKPKWNLWTILKCCSTFFFRTCHAVSFLHTAARNNRTRISSFAVLLDAFWNPMEFSDCRFAVRSWNRRMSEQSLRLGRNRSVYRFGQSVPVSMQGRFHRRVLRDEHQRLCVTALPQRRILPRRGGPLLVRLPSRMDRKALRERHRNVRHTALPEQRQVHQLVPRLLLCVSMKN